LYASQIQQQSEIDLKDLHNAISVFCQSATRFDQYARTVNLTRHTLEELGEINNFLFRFERKLAVGDGLPGRPWYRHRIYAPGTNTGYDVKTLPVLREAVEARSWHEAAAEAESLSKLYLELGIYLDAGARDHFGFGSESVRQAWEVGDGACIDSGPADDDGVP
jgi:N-acetylated-alpha-linked acidic dipeptidase